MENKEKAMKSAAYMLSRRDLTEKALRKKLAEKDYTPDEIEYTLTKMKDYGAVDDEKYVRTYIQQLQCRGYGKARIKQALYEKGIERDLIDAGVADFCPNMQVLMDFFHKKLKGDVGDRAKNQKAAAALYRRGFSYSEINAALKQYGEELEEDAFD